ncbi:MAG: acetyl-CoA C-acetyltransferase [Pseudonocardiales bacterium]|nr:acetyl-CoA C-acetyltransferase [Pseudonocardiales bacterium]MDT7582806.1 acetyl-CoA C-acetyltransferase [Pseudonocardiales bacterium]MDT7611531.1 acetyl-CoA C-acetyltransferase [Pseudonocardiales bacterium]MDT7658120.1 acetyl-CoA C-acetyltransferase [Pseudonocardiales bacterium]MDT7664842.1 acetyl-CoA C-acetyltransferase [Pseudonocardiales bacterium]
MIVSAVRSPLGRRGKGLSQIHPATLLGRVQRAALEKAGVDPASVGQVIGGCVAQVGEQSFNLARTAWLSEGLPESVAATTVDAQCGSSQQALTLASALVGAGVVDLALACGVESMSRIPIGSNFRKDFDLGRPVPKDYLKRYEFLNQYQAAERIAEKWGVTREQADGLGLSSQQRAAAAWADGRFDGQIVPITDPEGAVVSRDEGLRETSAEALAALKTVVPDGVHTAGSASQISDGASAVLVASERRAAELNLEPLARIVDTATVGVDPVMMLLGPHEVTPMLLRRNKLGIDEVDLVEINEAFASVVLSWAADTDVDMAKVNPNGGAIAMGHPLGGSGCVLTTKAVHELRRSGGRYGLVTMCCGGGLGTGTLLERL